MSNPYIGEIRLLGFNFAPVGWIPCDGRLLSIAEYETLFVLIGTTYGGDGQSTFAVPDLRGRIPICAGCKQVRDREGAWNRLEAYLEAHSHAEFTHGLCESCQASLHARTLATR